MAGDKKSGLPPFHDELCQLLGQPTPEEEGKSTPPPESKWDSKAKIVSTVKKFFGDAKPEDFQKTEAELKLKGPENPKPKYIKGPKWNIDDAVKDQYLEYQGPTDENTGPSLDEEPTETMKLVATIHDELIYEKPQKGDLVFESVKDSLGNLHVWCSSGKKLVIDHFDMWGKTEVAKHIADKMKETFSVELEGIDPYPVFVGIDMAMKGESSKTVVQPIHVSKGKSVTFGQPFMADAVKQQQMADALAKQMMGSLGIPASFLQPPATASQQAVKSFVEINKLSAQVKAQADQQLRKEFFDNIGKYLTLNGSMREHAFLHYLNERDTLNSQFHVKLPSQPSDEMMDLAVQFEVTKKELAMTRTTLYMRKETVWGGAGEKTDPVISSLEGLRSVQEKKLGSISVKIQNLFIGAVKSKVSEAMGQQFMMPPKVNPITDEDFGPLTDAQEMAAKVKAALEEKLSGFIGAKTEAVQQQLQEAADSLLEALNPPKPLSIILTEDGTPELGSTIDEELAEQESEDVLASDLLTKDTFYDVLVEALSYYEGGSFNAAEACLFFNKRLPDGAPKLWPGTVVKGLQDQYSKELDLWFQGQADELQAFADAPEVIQITLTGLTPEEAEEVQKLINKSKSKDILIHKTVRKELGSGAKPIAIWPFESSSMQVNNEPVLYKAQLNEDGTISCNCPGWCMGSAKSKSGRTCKHTKLIKVEAEVIYKKWKKGEPLGEDFEVVPAAAAEAGPKALFKALKEKVVPGSDTVFKAKRIVEI